MTFNSATLNGVAITPAQSGQQLTFTNVKSPTDPIAGEVAPGTAGTIVINATIGAAATGTLTNTASINSNETATISTSATTTVVDPGGGGTPALAISLSGGPDPRRSPGDTVTYTVTVVSIRARRAPPACRSQRRAAAGQLLHVRRVQRRLREQLAVHCFVERRHARQRGASVSLHVHHDRRHQRTSGRCHRHSRHGEHQCDGHRADRQQYGERQPQWQPESRAFQVGEPEQWSRAGRYRYLHADCDQQRQCRREHSGRDRSDSFGIEFSGNITATLGSGSFDAVNNRVVFNVGTLASGASATLSFDVTVEPARGSGDDRQYRDRQRRERDLTHGERTGRRECYSAAHLAEARAGTGRVSGGDLDSGRGQRHDALRQ